jgi:hypothetical protein
MVEKQYDINEAIAIDENGDFDPSLIPEEMRESVERIAKGMIDGNLIEKKKIRCKRKPKPRVKNKKTFGKNKKKKK